MGLSTAVLFAQEGAKVAITGRNQGRGQRVVQEIEQDRSYSRKYVRSVNDLEGIPPGIISKNDFRADTKTNINLSKDWEDALGSDFYKTIVECPKSSIQKRVEDLLLGRKNGR